MGAKFQVGDIPADLVDQAAEWREKLLEQVVELDDDVMEKYLDVSRGCGSATAAVLGWAVLCCAGLCCAVSRSRSRSTS